MFIDHLYIVDGGLYTALFLCFSYIEFNASPCGFDLGL